MSSSLTSAGDTSGTQSPFYPGSAGPSGDGPGGDGSPLGHRHLVNPASMSSLPSIPLGEFGITAAHTDGPYQMNANAYGSVYATVAGDGDGDGDLRSPSSGYLTADSRKDTYAPINMDFTNTGGMGFPSFESGSHLQSVGEGFFLKPTLSLYSGGAPGQGRGGNGQGSLNLIGSQRDYSNTGSNSLARSTSTAQSSPVPAHRGPVDASGTEEDTARPSAFPKSIVLNPSSLASPGSQSRHMARPRVTLVLSGSDRGDTSPLNSAAAATSVVPGPHPVPEDDSAEDTDDGAAKPSDALAPTPPFRPPRDLMGSGSSSSSSVSASAASSEAATPDGSGPPVLPADPLPSPPPPLPPAVRGFLSSVTPLVQQDDYRKTDLKDIACTAEYTCVDLIAGVTVTLQPIRPMFLERYEPATTIRSSIVKAGRVSLRREAPRGGNGAAGTDAGPEARVRPPAEVTVDDFSVSAVAYENFMLALSLALYGSVLYHDDIAQAAMKHFGRTHGGSSSGSTASGIAASSSDAEAPADPAVPPARVHVALPVLLRWLNELGIDVLIMTTDRRAASSSCAKRRQVKQREELLGGGGGRDAVGPAPFVDCSPLHRVLVALEYDMKQKIWGPVALSRPIRVVAAARHAARRERRRLAVIERTVQEQRCAEEAVEREEADRIAAKWDAWRAKQAAWELEAELDRQHRQQGTSTGDEAERGLMLPVSKGDDDDSQELAVPVSSAGVKTGLPFASIEYPNLVQTDCGCGAVLRQSTNPNLGRIRLKLMVGAPLEFIATCIGVALIVYVSKMLRWCHYDTALARCLDAADVTTSEESSGSGTTPVHAATCAASFYFTSFDSSPANRFLYGKPAAVGNGLIVAVSCIFAALLATVLFVFFITRFMATGSMRAVFFHVMQIAHVLLCCISCAFAAYAVFVFSRSSQDFDCSLMKPADSQLCSARMAACGDMYRFQLYQEGRSHVTLALSIVLLVLCGLSLVVALVPALPPLKQREQFPVAQPQTYAFRPSVYAPDGISPEQRLALQEALRPDLQRQLQRRVQHRDGLLKHNASIGEMMQANRDQSLRKMELNKAKESRRRRGGGRADRKSRKVVRYAVFLQRPEPFELDDASGTDGTSANGRSRDPHDPIDDIVLSPALLADVRAITRRVRQRRAKGEEAATAAPDPNPRRSSPVTFSELLPRSPTIPYFACERGSGTDSAGDGDEATLPRSPTGRRDAAARERSSSTTHESPSGHGSLPRKLATRSHSVSGIFTKEPSGGAGSPFERSRSFRRRATVTAVSNPFSPVTRDRVERQSDKVLRQKEPVIQGIIDRLQKRDGAAQ